MAQPGQDSQLTAQGASPSWTLAPQPGMLSLDPSAWIPQPSMRSQPLLPGKCLLILQNSLPSFPGAAFPNARPCPHQGILEPHASHMASVTAINIVIKMGVF